jgi:hypothetical protein
MYDSWIVTANRYGDEGGYFWHGHLTVSDPVGELRVKEIGAERYVYYEMGFVSGQPIFKRVLRKAYVRASLVVHVIKSLGIALDFVKDRIRVLRRRRAA